MLSVKERLARLKAKQASEAEANAATKEQRHPNDQTGGGTSSRGGGEVPLASMGGTRCSSSTKSDLDDVAALLQSDRGLSVAALERDLPCFFKPAPQLPAPSTASARELQERFSLRITASMQKQDATMAARWRQQNNDAGILALPSPLHPQHPQPPASSRQAGEAITDGDGAPKKKQRTNTEERTSSGSSIVSDTTTSIVSSVVLRIPESAFDYFAQSLVEYKEESADPVMRASRKRGTFGWPGFEEEDDT